MLRFTEFRNELAQCNRFIDGNDIGARHLHVVDPQLAEFEQIGEHHALPAGKRGILPLALFNYLFKAFANGVAVPAAQSVAQPLQECRERAAVLARVDRIWAGIRHCVQAARFRRA